jgi:hypothetical protein
MARPKISTGRRRWRAEPPFFMSAHRLSYFPKCCSLELSGDSGHCEEEWRDGPKFLRVWWERRVVEEERTNGSSARDFVGDAQKQYCVLGTWNSMLLIFVLSSHGRGPIHLERYKSIDDAEGRPRLNKGRRATSKLGAIPCRTNSKKHLLFEPSPMDDAPTFERKADPLLTSFLRDPQRSLQVLSRHRHHFRDPTSIPMLTYNSTSSISKSPFSHYHIQTARISVGIDHEKLLPYYLRYSGMLEYGAMPVISGHWQGSR